MRHRLHLLATSPVHRARVAATLGALARSGTAGMRWWWRRVAWENRQDLAGEVARLHAENQRLRALLTAEQPHDTAASDVASSRAAAADLTPADLTPADLTPAGPRAAGR